MASPAPNPLQVSRDERRAVLSRHFVAVVEALIAGGEPYADLSVERLIRAANISRSTFYAYFDDKGDLLGAMAANVIADLVETGDSWWGFDERAGRGDLREAIRAPIESYRRHRTIFGAVSETAAYDPRVREQQRRLIDQVVAQLADHIRAAQKSGAAARALDPGRTAQWLIWMIERGLYQLVCDASDAEAEKLVESVTDVVWRTLYAGHR